MSWSCTLYLCLQWRSPWHSFAWTISGKIICFRSQQAEINWFELCMAKPCFVFWVFLIYFAAFPVDLPQVAWFDFLALSSRNVNSCGITNGVDGYFCMELTAQNIWVSCFLTPSGAHVGDFVSSREGRQLITSHTCCLAPCCGISHSTAKRKGQHYENEGFYSWPPN